MDEPSLAPIPYSLHSPHVLAQEIADDLQTVLDQFAGIAGELREG